MILLHGSFVDEFLIEIVLPISIFGGLYWWSSRKEKEKQKRAQTPGPPVERKSDDR
ncbi:MAG: hypothetical protein M3Z65_04390 [Chloroflexota bacterium]|nr:hypothetical protein [Chloroflexota bacterium]